MNENLNSETTKIYECNENSEENDYNNLITRLNEIKSTIASIEKTIFK